MKDRKSPLDLAIFRYLTTYQKAPLSNAADTARPGLNLQPFRALSSLDASEGPEGAGSSIDLTEV